ncbi:hypothetical protein AAG570_002999 [Ranatra chinensis]|uniref:Uncharacterized protein n=1 Tax=Ranatra chinensis TaxID=642074 RepID=A0ABD0Y5Z6_9HEMI
MLVKDWGTASHVNRLAYSTYDIFKGAFNIITAAQRGSYPIEDIKHVYSHEWNEMNATVQFHAFNGWLENLSLEPRTTQKGNLRRFLINRAERTNFPRAGGQHELFVCDRCLALVSNRIHYAYESTFHKYETKGIIENGPLYYTVNFQMTVITAFNKTINRYNCYTNLEPVILDMEVNNQFISTVEGIGIFNFLADTMDQWIFDHFNNTVRNNMQHKIDTAVRKVLNKRNICEEFLSY